MGGRARAYGANKRRKEVARKAKQDDKRRRRLERGKAGPEPEGMKKFSALWMNSMPTAEKPAPTAVSSSRWPT